MNQDTREQPLTAESELERESAYSHGYGDGKRDAERAVHDRGAEEIASQDALDASMPDDDGLFAVHDRGADPLREAVAKLAWAAQSVVLTVHYRQGKAYLTMSSVAHYDALTTLRTALDEYRAALGEEPHGQ